MSVVCLAVFWCQVAAFDEISCEVAEKYDNGFDINYDVDIDYDIVSRPESFNTHYVCNLNTNSSILIAETKLTNENNENVTQFLGNDIKKLEYLPIDIVDSFPKVTHISFSETSLKSISKKNFHGLRNLEILSLSYNQISSIDEDTFDDLSDLFSIDLDHNKLTSLPPKVFSKLSTLNGLHLEDNQLTALDAGIFKNNHELAFLVLNGNKLTTLSPGIFDSLTQMRQLLFHENEINSLDADLFKNCISLDYLSGSDNKITEIPLNLFTPLTSLSTILFSNNPLNGVIDFKMFENNKEINFISFDGIKFTKVLNIDVVDKLPELRRVQFRINNESCIIGNYHEGILDKLKNEVKTYCKME